MNLETWYLGVGSNTEIVSCFRTLSCLRQFAHHFPLSLFIPHNHLDVAGRIPSSVASMTTDFLHTQLTDSIAQLEHYYPLDIFVGHPQLRNLISTRCGKKIFYVHLQDVCVLDIDSREKTILVTIPFGARCLAADHGWICVGGQEAGHCALIYIGEEGWKTNSCYTLDVMSLGTDIVNSFTIHKIRNDREPNQEEIIALASNNDCTVTVYSLTKQAILDTKDFPKAMNYATLSPDGKIMAAVGDEDKVYFLECDLALFSEKLEDRVGYDEAWRFLCAPNVPTVKTDADDFSFAIAFSSLGQLCASSSRAGIITVFDMDVIKDRDVPAEQAIICAFRSSRDNLFGYVRSMAFSPAPWDVLAWTENFGTVGFADVRRGFCRKQHAKLSRNLDKTVQVKDVTPDDWRNVEAKDRQKKQHQQRMQALRGHPPVGARTLNEDRRPESRMGHPPRVNGSFSDRERSVLASLETSSREMRAPAALPAPFSITYSSNPQIRHSASSANSRREYEIQLLNPSSTHIGRGPRRRSSVVLSEPRPGQRLAVHDNSRATMTASPAQMLEDNSIAPMSTNDLTPSAGSNFTQPLPYNIPPSDPWHVIEAQIANNRATPNTIPTSRGLTGLSQVDTALHSERRLSDRVERQHRLEIQMERSLRSELEGRGRSSQSHRDDVERQSVVVERDSSRQEQWRTWHEQSQRRTQSLQEELRVSNRIINQLTTERNNLMDRHRSSSQALLNTQVRLEPLTESHRARRQRVEQLEQEMQEAQAQFERSLINMTPNHNIETASSMPELAEGDFRRLVNIPMVVARESPVDQLPPGVPDFMTIQNRTSHLSPENRGSPQRVRSTNSEQRTPGLPSLTSVTLPPDPENLTQMQQIEHRAVFSTADDLENLSRAAIRSTIPATSELAGRVTAEDWRTARWMITHTSAPAPIIDQGWAQNSLSRIYGGRVSAAAQEELKKEAGIGTAGISWSRTGTRVYVGSEEGIFEFKLNLQDRMQVPVIEMR